jgi:hypothetical protein
MPGSPGKGTSGGSAISAGFGYGGSGVSAHGGRRSVADFMEAVGGNYNPSVVGSGAGGSSYISGYSGCRGIEETSTENSIIHSKTSLHYSGKSFVDTKMIAGNASMPNYDGTGSMTGNAGNGLVKITYISARGSDSKLKSLKPDKGEMLEEFSPEKLEYNIKLKEDEYIVNFILETQDPLSTIDRSEYVDIIVPARKIKS